MIHVTCKVPVYERTGGEARTPDEIEVRTNLLSDRIELVVDGRILVVVARDLIAAAQRAEGGFGS